MDLLFNFYLVDKKSRKSVLEEPEFKKAFKALGMLKRDQMYAYTLPLAMGGNPVVKNMTKAKIREHLSILAGIHREA